MNIHSVVAGAVTFSVLAACVTLQRISYREDVVPILARNCLECHTPPRGKGYLKTRLNLESYESLMQGSAYGPVILPGDSRHSILNMLIEGRLDASMRLPEPLTAGEIETLRLWVDQGARNN